jgi:hypothetical protein
MYSKQYRKRKRLIRDLKRRRGVCVDCQLNIIHLLEFDHVEGRKIHNVSQINLQLVYSEADKCVLRCRNCHRLKHQQEIKISSNIWKHRNHQYVNMIKTKIGKCLQCGKICHSSNTFMFDFDHLKSYRKLAKVSKLVRYKYSLKVIRKEVGKCQLLCANCHHIKTLFENNIFKNFKIKCF